MGDDRDRPRQQSILDLVETKIARRTGYDPHSAVCLESGTAKVLRSGLSVSALNAPRKLRQPAIFELSSVLAALHDRQMTKAVSPAIASLCYDSH
jgi:hypothetical protein